MAARKHRTRAQREQHLADVERLYLDGVPKEDIAARLGVAKSQITYDVKRIAERWRQSALVDFDQAIGQQLARIDAMEREAWRAWHQSTDDSETVLVEESDGPNGVRRASVRRATQGGDVGHMRNVLAAVRQRSKLLGLYPTAQERRARGAPGISAELLEQIVAAHDEQEGEDSEA